MDKIRLLRAEEIEVRPSHIKDGKANMLLYIDSRAATTLLDETYGIENWNLEYKTVNNTIYGRLSIWDKENNRYVYREDTGEEANISKDKSIASDILKRLIVRFGVTELYTSPKIQINDDGYGNTGYKVTNIEYNNNRQITNLTISNRFGKEVFNWCANTTNPTTTFVQNPTQSSIDATEKIQTIVDKQIENKALTNEQKLKEYYINNRTTENDEKLKKFYMYYIKKANDWKGDFNVELLAKKWLEKAN